MNARLFKIYAEGWPARHVLATDRRQALHWFLDSHTLVEAMSSFRIEVIDDVVNLVETSSAPAPAATPPKANAHFLDVDTRGTGGEQEQPPPEAPAAAAEEEQQPGTAAGEPAPAGSVEAWRQAGPGKEDETANDPPDLREEITNAEAMELLGCNAQKIQNLKYQGTLQPGARGMVKRESVEAYKRSQEASSTGEKVQKAAKEEWKPVERSTDDFKSILRAAQLVGLTPEQLREVKYAGHLGGGNDWVNFTQLQAYMKHPSFERPIVG